ncbi:hypothetical protein ALC56_03808 [Trachymyrmex septentrionalis]|uniref:Uncharacterized protein n=1 Tax=Trachymyrmex septentrionalis TaxID=34720 RepID=A0A151JZE9_9HYME|nr:hypothetical protein ALC56_03808 [Trachymyrmex septentrionalis]
MKKAIWATLKHKCKGIKSVYEDLTRGDLLQRCRNIDLREQRLPFLLSKMQNRSGQPAYSSTRVMLERGIANLRPRFYDLRFMAVECIAFAIDNVWCNS